MKWVLRLLLLSTTGPRQYLPFLDKKLVTLSIVCMSVKGGSTNAYDVDDTK